MLKYAKLGVATGFAFDWGEYFDVTLKNEVQYIMEHPDLPVTYRDIDRPRAGNVNEMLKNEGKKKKKELMHRLRPTIPWQWR